MNNFKADNNIDSSSLAPIGGGGGGSDRPPALPPRPSAPLSATTDFGYGSPFGGFGGGMFNANNGYNFANNNNLGGYYNAPFGGYHYGGLPNFLSALAGRPGIPPGPDHTLHSLESFVRAVSSISMMLESSLAAIYSSFGAVAGVADNFMRLKANFVGILASFRIIQTLRWLWRKLLVYLRLRNATDLDSNWANLVSSGGLPHGDGQFKALKSGKSAAGGTNWISLIVFAIAIGGPLLLWKLASKIGEAATKKWASGDADHYTAMALFDFQPDRPEELALRKGLEIRVAPKDQQPAVRGWLLASNGATVGLVPSNYIRILGKKIGRETQSYSQNAAGNSSAVIPASSAIPLPVSDSGSAKSSAELEELFNG